MSTDHLSAIALSSSDFINFTGLVNASTLDEFTVAVKVKRLSGAQTDIFSFLNDTFLRLDTNGNVLFTVESKVGANHKACELVSTSTYALNDEIAIVASVSRTEAKLVINGTLEASASYADFGDHIVPPVFINTWWNTGDGATDLEVMGNFWYGESYLDAASVYSSFFDLSHNPKDLGSGVVSSVTPAIYQAGSASDWNAGLDKLGQVYLVTGSVADV